MGPVYALAALLILAGIDLWIAGWVLILALWFCGYTSLEFQPRHVFHLSFLAFWAPAFLVHCTWRAAKCRGIDGTRVLSAAASSSAFALVSVALLGGVYVAAEAIQYRQMRPLIDRYYNAELEPVAFTHTGPSATSTDYYQVKDLFRPPFDLSSPGGVLTEFMFEPGAVQSEYLVAEVEPGTANGGLTLCCRDPEKTYCIDFNHCAVGDAQRTVRVFVPVFKYLAPFRLNNPGAPLPDVDGVETRTGTKLKALYRVRNPKAFALPMLVVLPDDPGSFVWRHDVRFASDFAGV
jgi:hypothetical protein